MNVNLPELDGARGIVLNGIDADDQSGVSVSSVGDVNGDGIDDLIIGAFCADPVGNSSAGESSVVFGGPQFFSDTATVTITVSDADGPAAPIANDNAFSTDEDVRLSGDVLANGSDRDNADLVVTLVSDGQQGTLVLNEDGNFTYVPDADVFGADSLTYEVSDGELTDTATVAITIDPANDRPVAANHSETTPTIPRSSSGFSPTISMWTIRF